MQVESSADPHSDSLRHSTGEWLIGQPSNLEEILEEAYSCMSFTLRPFNAYAPPSFPSLVRFGQFFKHRMGNSMSSEDVFILSKYFI